MDIVDNKFVYTLDADARYLKSYAVPTIVVENPTDDITPTWFTNALRLKYPFLSALMGSPATASLFVTENGKRKYRQTVWNCETNELEVLTGKTIYTELPPDIGTACCHTKPDLNGTLTKARPMRLCLKDCRDDLTEHFTRLARQGFSIFGGQGSEEEYFAELRAWFAFFQARDIMYGQTTVVGNNIARFPGVLELMEKSVVAFSGADIVGLFEQLACRFSILPGNYIFGAHPLLITSIIESVTRDGKLLPGFTRNGDALTFKGYRIVPDILIPINLTEGSGQIWIADLNKNGVFMEYDLMSPKMDKIDSYTDSQTGDCFESCVFLKNYGFAFSKDFNSIYRVTDVPLTKACVGSSALLGLGGLVNPDTLVPNYS